MTASPALSRRLAAEALGTAFLLATVIGSGIMAERLSPDNVAVALLGNTIPTGAILVVLIWMFGPLSGAHFNPAVTMGFALRDGMTGREAGLYVVAQLIGGLAGMLAAHGMFAMELAQWGVKPRTGSAQWFSEAVATFGLVLTIFMVVRMRPAAVAAAVGLYITAAYWFTASTSFANPAVTIARSFTDSFAGIRLQDAPLFILFQLIGAALAVACDRWFFSERTDPS